MEKEEEKRREKERLRKANDRAKKRAIEDGSYVYTPIEKAKNTWRKWLTLLLKTSISMRRLQAS